ncbi:hypothetical protein HYX17_02535 [Candidatus Woesearchaeota archaeon]|nr:hypothetical protein [Candidatus Woesearchaeota archaeon]
MGEILEIKKQIVSNGARIQKQIYLRQSEISYIKNYQKLFSVLVGKDLSFSHVIRLLIFRKLEEDTKLKLKIENELKLVR